MSKIKVIALGTNGWYTTETGNTTCVFLDTPKSYIVLDAGNGIRDIDKHIADDKKPIFLFMSHFHFDHITGMHILNKFKFPQGMTICCFKGGRAILDKIVCQPHTIPFNELKMNVDFKELDAGVHKDFPFDLTCRELKHSSKTFGYRFGFGGKIISFCTDTGYCEAAVELSRNADLLITECAYLTGHTLEAWPHLNPEEAARVAKDAEAKKLLLIHFDADNYKTFEDRENAQKKAQETFPETTAARDGMTVEV